MSLPKPNPANRCVLVYDVGGSHVSAALCSEHTYALHGITRAPLPDHFSAASFVRLIHSLGQASANAANLELPQIAGAALAMPGPFDYQNGVSHMEHKLHSLFNFDLKSALAAHLRWQPSQIRFVNDAAAFTLGEAGAGAAKGFSRAIGITLGTGIGAAFAIDKQIADSSESNTEGVPPGGEIWNLPYNGETVEDFVSTRFLRHHYQDLTGLHAEVSEVAAIAECRDNQPCPPLEALAQKQIQAPTFESTEGAATASPAIQARKLASTPSKAREAFRDFGRHLGQALNQHAAAFHPDVIVLGGGISRATALFLPATHQALNFPTQIAIAALMDEAPLAGAGVHWFSQPS